MKKFREEGSVLGQHTLSFRMVSRCSLICFALIRLIVAVKKSGVEAVLVTAVVGPVVPSELVFEMQGRFAR